MTCLITNWEQRGLDCGLEQGLEQGRRELVLRQLGRRCGPLDRAARDRMGALPGAQIGALAEALLDFTGRSDLDRWVERHSAGVPR